mmetsp:Transcript_16378/g.34545  ORF Transcript_16378/g.34545 Transcript_16378/m.34545 type:complete len:161 (+) Transcript_16378:56-538(+)
MVEFGRRLAENRAPEYPPDAYMDYDRLKEIIEVMKGKKLARIDSTTREVSLSAPPPTNAVGRQLTSDGSEEDFYSCIDAQLVTVEAFTLQKVTELRANIASLEKEVANLGSIDHDDDDDDDDDEEEVVERVREKADDAAKDFLILEKYVNINFMGECLSV